MIAGGTGITPMLQVVRAVLKNTKDTIHMSLIYANQTEGDILLKNEIEKMVVDTGGVVGEMGTIGYSSGSSGSTSGSKSTFRVFYTVDRPTDDWKYGVGFINTDMCAKHLPNPNVSNPNLNSKSNTNSDNSDINSTNSMVFMCGPTPMITYACQPALSELGYDESQLFVF